jgi:DNA modification methylase
MPKITDYKPLPNNPNKGTQKGVGAVEQSVRQLGAGRSILVDKDGIIIAGNHAQEAFVNAGIDDVIEVETDGNQIVVVKRTDMTADSAAGKKMAIMDNRSSELGLSWDDVVIEQMMADIAQEDGEIDRWLEELAADVGIELNDNAGTDTEPEIDKAEELRVKWGVELGQMWKLGEHRIICGDCTDRAVVERLMGGKKADMVFTDPPYALFGNSTGVAGIVDDKMVMPFFREIFKTSKEFCKLFAHIYVCCDWHSAFAIESSARDISIPAKNLCIWDKGDGGVGAMYQQCYEMVWLFDNSPQRTTLGKGATGVRTVNGVPNIWRVGRESSNRMHGAQKPTELVKIPITNGSDSGEIVVDWFVGSGTTIIACENLNRKCRAVEISPAYVAVSIERWHQHTGLMPELME